MKLIAWHNNPGLKTEVAARMAAHRAEDSIVQGLYQEAAPELATGYRGCLIGCTLPRQREEDSWHERAEALYGIDRHVGRLLDRIFE